MLMRLVQDKMFQHASGSYEALSGDRATVLAESNMSCHAFYVTLLCIGTYDKNFSSGVQDARQEATVHCSTVETPRR